MSKVGINHPSKAGSWTGKAKGEKVDIEDAVRKKDQSGCAVVVVHFPSRRDELRFAVWLGSIPVHSRGLAGLDSALPSVWVDT